MLRTYNPKQVGIFLLAAFVVAGVTHRAHAQTYGVIVIDEIRCLKASSGIDSKLAGLVTDVVEFTATEGGSGVVVFDNVKAKAAGVVLNAIGRNTPKVSTLIQQQEADGIFSSPDEVYIMLGTLGKTQHDTDHAFYPGGGKEEDYASGQRRKVDAVVPYLLGANLVKEDNVTITLYEWDTFGDDKLVTVKLSFDELGKTIVRVASSKAHGGVSYMVTYRVIPVKDLLPEPVRAWTAKYQDLAEHHSANVEEALARYKFAMFGIEGQNAGWYKYVADEVNKVR